MNVTVNGVETESQKPEGITIALDGNRLLVHSPDGTRSGLAVRHGDTTYVSYLGRTYEIKKATATRSGPGAAGSGQAIAPMPGQIVEIAVEIDQKVEQGQKLAVLEAMKMQLPVLAGISGTVKSIPAKVGDQVSDGQTLVVVEPD